MQILNARRKTAAGVVIPFDSENRLASAPLGDSKNHSICHVTTRNEHISPCIRHLMLNHIVVRDYQESHDGSLSQILNP